MKKVKIKGVYFILITGVILSGLLFGLKLRSYYQAESEYSYTTMLYSGKPSEERQKENSGMDKSKSYYINLLQRKNFFKILGRQTAPRKEEKAEPQIDIDQEISKFELLGIVSIEGESQALIKNKRTGETFRCIKGQKINGFLIMDILLDKIIFKFREQVAELRL